MSILLMILPIKKAVTKLLPSIIKHWKEILIVSIVAFSVWKYHDMTSLIALQEAVIMQDKLIIESHEANELILTNSIDKQNSAIESLKDISDSQELLISEAATQSEEIRNQYAEENAKLLLDKSHDTVTCEQNMKWLVDTSKEIQWKSLH